MATVATLSIAMKAQTGQLRKDFKKVESQTKRMATSMKSAAAGMKGAFAGLIAAIGLRKLVGSLRQTLDELDQIAKQSRRIGISAKELQTFRLAAQFAGIEVAGMDKALQKMQQNLGMAAKGTGAAKDALDLLGLSAEKMLAMTPTQQFQAISKAFGSIEAPAQRASIAADLFGRAGLQLVELLRQGDAAFAGAVDSIDKYNLALTETELAKVEEANDAAALAAASFARLKAELAIGLAPLLKVIALRFAEWSAGAREAGATSGNVFSAIAKAGAVVIDIGTGISRAFAGVRALITAAQAAFTGLLLVVSKGVVAVIKTAVDGLNLIGLGPELSKDFGSSVTEGLSGALASLTDSAKKDFEKFGKLGSEPFFKTLQQLEEIIATPVEVAKPEIDIPSISSAIEDSTEKADKQAAKAPAFAAFQKGTADAINEVLKFQTGRGADPAIKVAEKQLDEGKKQTSLQEEIVEKLGAGATIGPAVGV